MADPFTCSLAMLVYAALGGGGEARALPITFQDDALLLNRPPAQVHATARRMAALGADRVRITAGWSVLAPHAKRRRAPRFDATNPDAYPREPWTRLDTAVKAVTEAGLEPQIDVAFFAPRWAVSRVVWSRNPGRHRWNPDTRRFAQFARAVAKRYDGTHPDHAHRGQRLPAVRLWTTWNEPNHSAFLLPQWRRVRGRWVPRSPDLYRALHRRGHRAIKSVSSANRVLIGGLSAEGTHERGPRKVMRPLHFLRELACVNRRLRPIRRGGCRNFQPLRADGFSTHPYSLYSAPDVPSREQDFVRLGDLDDLSTLLEALYKRRRLASRLPIYVTEYGYETNPPDVVRGVSLRAQARYHGLATYMAWRRPEVSAFAQFLLHDIPPPPDAKDKVEASRDWHSGLYFHDGRAKPAVQAFKLPFWAEARRLQTGAETVVVFGQIRPPVGRQRAEVQLRGSDGAWRSIRTLDSPGTTDASCSSWTESTEFLTDEHGFFLRLAAYEGPFTYRTRWVRQDGGAEYSVPVTIGRPRPLPTTGV